MARKNSFLLAVLLIANPFMLLFFQNCSSFSQTAGASTPAKTVKVQTSQEAHEVVRYVRDKAF